MEPMTLISFALAGIKLATQSIEAANAGNVAEAERLLDLSRNHYAQAREGWDAAAGPTE